MQTPLPCHRKRRCRFFCAVGGFCGGACGPGTSNRGGRAPIDAAFVQDGAVEERTTAYTVAEEGDEAMGAGDVVTAEQKGWRHRHFRDKTYTKKKSPVFVVFDECAKT